MTQHSDLAPERWAAFPLDQQIVMIANEMNRAGKLFAPADRTRFRNSCERVLALTDLTIAVNARPGLRRELLRWRDLIAELYVSEDPDPARHGEAFHCLCRLLPGASLMLR